MLDLKAFVPNGRVSTGLLGSYQGRLVWAVSREAYWRKTSQGVMMGLVAIGGGQEEGETLLEALRREAMEEARSRICVSGAHRTVWADGDGKATIVDLSRSRAKDPATGCKSAPADVRDQRCNVIWAAEQMISSEDEPAPVLIWQAPLNYLNSTGEWHTIDYICAVYCGEFLDPPEPASEVTGLVFCTAKDFRTMVGAPVSLRRIVSSGGNYVGKELPKDTHFELHGSALYLARHWDLLEKSESGVGSGT